MGEIEHKIIHALAGIAGFPATAVTAGRSCDFVAGYEFLVAGQNLPLPATATMAKLRLRDILPRDADFVAPIGICDAAFVYGIRYSLFDVFAIATQESPPIDSALMLAVRPTIDYAECHGTSPRFAYP